jgi:hypothetical protein
MLQAVAKSAGEAMPLGRKADGIEGKEWAGRSHA